MSKIYKNSNARIEFMKLYDQKLKSLQIQYSNIDVDTSFGKTRVVKTGNETKEKIVMFHGYNAGAPLTLEPILGILDKYCIYVVETVGQATKSAETRINISDNSYAKWVDDVLTGLSLDRVNIIGISYGAFIAQKVMTYHPERIKKCVLVVPSGIVNGNFWKSTKMLTLPMLRWKITKKEEHLKAFINAFAPIENEHIYKMLSLNMTGIKLDTRIPKTLKPSDIKHFTAPVYIIAATDDVYFPGEKIAHRSKGLFSNLQEVHLLEGSKHMPSKEHYSTIQQKIVTWIPSS